MPLTTMRKPSVLQAFAVLGVLSIVTTFILLLILAAQLFASNESLKVAAVLAAFFNIGSLATFSYLIWRQVLHQQQIADGEEQSLFRRRFDILINFAFSLVAGITTLTTVIWMRFIIDDLPAKNFSIQPWSYLVSIIVGWSLSILFQVVLILLILRSQIIRSTTPPPLSIPEVAALATPKGTARSSIFSTRKSPSSPPHSPRSPISPSFSSLRSSMTIPSRSVSSKTRLIPSRPTSKAEASPFDNWDTSNVPPPLRETVHVVRANTHTPLTPIPGSRPASPAKPLDGPFLPPSPHPQQSYSPQITSPSTDSLPLQPPLAPFVLAAAPSPRSRASSMNNAPSSPVTLATNSSSCSLTRLPPVHTHSSPLLHSNSTESFHTLPRVLSSASLASSVQHLRTTASFDEDHIHPLFRSSSPTPPPSATISTTITAANPNEAVEELISAAANPTKGRRRIMSGGPSPSQVSSPLARAAAAEWGLSDTSDTGSDRNTSDSEETTPTKAPIPDFVLTADKRGSLLGFVSRKKKDGTE